MSLAVIEPKAEYDRKNEAAFREEVRKLGGNAYDRRGDVVVPFGKRLAFTSAQGQTIFFGYNTDGNFTIQQDANTPFGLASLSYVSTVQSDLESSFASLETSLTADFADLSASFSTIATAFADIETAFAALEVDVEAANDAAAAAATSALAAATSATAAGTSATAAAGSATSASTSAGNASTSAGAAATSASNASTSASQASTSETNAAGSASTATTQATNASNSATSAGNSASAASTSASTAATHATNAGNSASSASTSASNAATSATNAANSASAASTSASTASTQATNAGNSATAAQTAQVAAESARDAAEDEADAAATSATAAAGSASTASTQASNAASSASAANTSATNAATSASGASTSASNAATSASQASTSETNAAGSASTASTQATNAANSASAASGSASAASTSASSASTSATNAGNSASAASTSATNAASSASSASTSASTATTQASNASASASSAASSATLSATFAAGSQGSINSSATFADNANATGVPTNWFEWTNAAADGTRQTGIAPQPYAYQQAGRAGENGGIYQPMFGRFSAGWHVIEADITLVSGALTGAGVLLNADPASVYTEYKLIFSTDADVNGSVVGAGTPGVLYKFRKLVQVGLGVTYNHIYAMSHYSVFGSIASANSIKFHRVAIRAASQAEIEARQAKLDLVTTNANVATNTSAITSANSAISSLSTTVSANFTSASRVNRNLLPNSTGFKGTAGWTNPGSWGAYAHPLWGHWFYRGFTGASGLTESFYTDEFTAYAGWTYYLSAVPYLHGLTAGAARFWLAFYNSSHSWLGEQSIWFTSSDSYNRLSSSIVAPTGTAYARFGCSLSGATGDSDYAEIGFWQAKVEFSGSTAWRGDGELTDTLSRVTTAEAAIVANSSAIVTETSARAAAVEEVRAYLTNKGDCIHDEFRDSTFWNLPVTGVSLIDTDGGWRWRRAIQLSNGTYDLYSDFFPVEPGATYRIRCRIWNNAGSWSGYFHPLIHMPYLAWYSLKHGVAVDPSVHDASNGIVAAADTGNLEWIFTNPTGITDNANRQWQFRFYGSFTGGPVVIACEIVRLDQYATVTTTASALSTLEGAAAVYEVIAAASGGTPARIGLKAGLGGSDVILDADQIYLGPDTYFETTYNTFVTTVSSRRKRYGGAFPASGDLVDWYGPTSVALNSETKTNGYWAQGTDGVIYYGAAALSTVTSYYGTHNGPAVASRTGAGYVTSGNVTITPVNGTAPFYYRYTMLENPNGIALNAVNGLGNNTFSINATITGGATWRCNVQVDITDATGRTTSVIVADNELYDDT